MKKLLIVLFLCSVCRGYVVDKPIMGVQLNHGHDLTRGLVGIWTFNDRPGVVGRTYDLSGNGNHGDLVADAHSVPGLFGSALDFDGTGDYVDIADNPLFDTGDLTIVAWVKPIDTTHRYIVELIDIKAILRMTEGGFFAFYAGASAASETIAALDEWCQVVGTLEGTTGKIYVNSILKRTSAGNTQISGVTGVGIGRYNGGSAYWNSQIDHVMAWSRALTSQEIASLYADPFQMFEQEELVVNAAAAPAGGQVIIIMMSSIPALLVVGLVGGLLYSRRAA